MEGEFIMKKMKKIVICVLVLCLVLFAAGCSNESDKIGKFTEANAGTWYRYGNINENTLIIKDGGIWEVYGGRDENGDKTISAKGTITYDEEAEWFGFEDEMSNKIYVCQPAADGIFEFNGDKYLLGENSILGFDEYVGSWYVDGDRENDYFLFEFVEDDSVMWKFFHSSGGGHISTDYGRLVWNGLKNAFIAYQGSEDFAVLTLEDSGELSSDGKTYILLKDDYEDEEDYYDYGSSSQDMDIIIQNRKACISTPLIVLLILKFQVRT